MSQATALLEANAGVYRYGARGQFHVATQGSNDPSEDDFDSTSDKLHKDQTASNPALLEQRTSVIGQEDWPMWGIIKIGYSECDQTKRGFVRRYRTWHTDLAWINFLT